MPSDSSLRFHCKLVSLGILYNILLYFSQQNCIFAVKQKQYKVSDKIRIILRN